MIHGNHSNSINSITIISTNIMYFKQFLSTLSVYRMGMPWEKGVKITPLPEEGKPGYLEEV